MGLQDGMVSAMAFLIEHEVGHLVHKDKPYNEISNLDSQRQEKEADIFSIRMLNDSGISLIPALSVLDRFLYAEIQYGKGASESTHPSSECRMALLMDSSSEIDNMLQDQSRQQEFVVRTGMTASNFKAFISEEKRKCNF